MINKPIVILVMEEINSITGVSDGGRYALIYTLRNSLGCEVLAYGYDHYFLEDLTRVKNLVESRRVVAVIVEEFEYDEDQHQNVIKQVRAIDKNLPIILFPHCVEEDVKGVKGVKRIYFYHPLSRRMIALLRRWLKKMEIPLDFFGTQDVWEAAKVCDALVNAYRVHHLDGNELGTPDYNHQLTAQALRIRLLGSALIQEEFDATLSKEPKPISDSGEVVYAQESARVEQMCANGRDDLWRLLDDARGWRGFLSDVSQGDRVEGFAIDPITLEYTRTSGFGAHQCAVIHLSSRVGYIEELEQGGSRFYRRKDKIERRIVSGVFFPEVEGFKTPFVQFRWIDIDDENRLIRFFTSTRLAIPLVFNGEFRLLGSPSHNGASDE